MQELELIVYHTIGILTTLFASFTSASLIA